MKCHLYTTLIAVSLLSSILAECQPGVAKRVKCTADPTQEYALLLPADHEATKTYPLIIFLDPGAQGNFSVNRYLELGAAYDVILAGSYNSSNFRPGASETSFLAIYNDIVKQFNIDAGRIWLCGFSGGARMAATLAMRYPVISGVIGCGAGFVDDQDDLTRLKAYAGIVGTADMNYGELMDNNEHLDGLKINNILLHFEGGHEWPPVLSMEKAMAWMMEMAGEKVNTVSSTDTLAWKRIQQQVDSGFLYTSWFECKQLEKISVYNENAKAFTKLIEAQKDFNSDKKLFENAREEETNLLNEFSIAFSQLLAQSAGGTIDKNTWDQHAQKLQRLQRNKNRYSQLAGRRCFDHSRRSCSEYYFHVMSEKNYGKALELATVLSYLEPSGPRGPLLMARAVAGSGNKKDCERFLKESVRKGLAAGRGVEEDPLLLGVLSADEIKIILQAKDVSE
jgi:pimeloyl-ACP methyl ester carboxylesterase